MVCTGQWQCFAYCMTCGAHGCVLWQPLCPMLGGPLCKNQQYVSHKKYFVPSWGTNVCCQKDLCGKVNVEILRFAPPPIWAKMAATARLFTITNSIHEYDYDCEFLFCIQSMDTLATALFNPWIPSELHYSNVFKCNHNPNNPRISQSSPP